MPSSPGDSVRPVPDVRPDVPADIPPDVRPDPTGACGNGAETGSAIVEFIFLAVLLMVPVVYLILTVGQVQGGAYAVVGAADQAAKVFVLHDDLPTAQASAEQAMHMAVTDLGFDPANAQLTIACDGGCLTPGTIVTAYVQLRIELPVVGSLSGVTANAATVDSRATQKVGRFK